MTAMKVLLATMSDLSSGSLEVFKFSIKKNVVMGENAGEEEHLAPAGRPS